jgi:hypothetical protein
MAAWARAVGMNSSVQITAAGTPSPSSAIPSCRLHELHDPQSPMAVTTASHRAASCRRTSGSATREALGFASVTTSRTR